MTPAEFAKRMADIKRTQNDTEHRHVLADRLMSECLKSNGFGAGVEIFNAMDKWYA